MGYDFDPLILVIPMIITARAVSHTVQMAERFFEDYEVHLPRIGDPDEAKIYCATIAMGELVVPGTLGIVTDVAGLLVIMVTSIPQMRDLAVFGAFWVASIIVTVEILHPILICYMPAPTEHEHFLPGFMVRFTSAIGNATTHPTGKYVIGVGVVFTLRLRDLHRTLPLEDRRGDAGHAPALAGPRVQRRHQPDRHALRRRRLDGGLRRRRPPQRQRRLGAGQGDGALRALPAHQHQPRRVDLAGAAAQAVLDDQPLRRPEVVLRAQHDGTVRAAIFQLQQNGPPGAMRPFMTDDGRKANISFFYPDHKGETILYATHYAGGVHRGEPARRGLVRLDMDHAAEGRGLLRPREPRRTCGTTCSARCCRRANHTLNVRIRQDDGSYEEMAVRDAAEANGLPDWIEEFQEDAHLRLRGRARRWRRARSSPGPTPSPTGSSTTSTTGGRASEFGIRAVAMNTKDLIVADMKAVDPTPKYQPTNSWTRGVQFVMAGGVMGILAAINDEVERSHVANISLIFIVIFVLHSVTYQSVAQRLHHLPADRDRHDGVAGLHGDQGRRPQHQHAARCSRWASGSASTTRSTSSTGYARRWPTPRHRRGGAARGAHHRHGGEPSPPRPWSAASSCGCSRTCASRRRWPSCWSS